MALSAMSEVRRLLRSRLRPASEAWHRSTADFTTWRSSSADSPACSTNRDGEPASTALTRSSWSDGSCSSRYNATCWSVTRRPSGRTKKYQPSATSTTYISTRNTMMAAGLKRNCSSP